MGKADITLDTHTLLWYLDSDYNNRLSNTAFEVISEAELSGTIYVPIISLAEALHQIDKQRFNITWCTIRQHIGHFCGAPRSA